MRQEAEIAWVLPLIRIVRGQRVILDSDLARLYGVPTKRLNQQVRRNKRRFPADFAFALTAQEVGLKRLQFATASRNRNLRVPPIVYTEHGAVMAAYVLNSEKAVAMGVMVVRAFVALRRAVLTQGSLSKKVAELARAVNLRLDGHDEKIEKLLKMLECMIEGPPQKRPKIGFRP